jgi:hypothetical protein
LSLRLTLILAAVGVLIAGALGLYWKGRIEGAAGEKPKTDVAQAQAAVAKLEVEGARASAARVDVVQRRTDDVDRLVAEFTPKALQSKDAHAPLDPDRLARLRDADDELCRLAPGLEGCGSSD